jgi:hypothetical protein
MTDLLHKGHSYGQYPVSWGNKPFEGRIYPVTIDQSFEPTTLINLCTVSKDSKEFFNDPKKCAEEMELQLFWVFTDDDGLQETEIDLKQSDITKKFLKRNYSQLDQTLQESVEEIDLLILDQIRLGGSEYQLTNAEVEFKGTNPETARSDVIVNLDFELESFQALDAICSFFSYKKDGDENASYIKIYDLVTLPNTQTVESNIQGTGFTNYYHPDFSRVRLKMFAQGDRDTNLIVDLTTIDHQLTRDSQTGKVKLTINYRGYFEQALNLSENDALADAKVSQERTKRKKEITRKANENKCEGSIVQSLLIAEEQMLLLESEENRAKFINRIFGCKVYDYELNETELSARTIGTTIDPRYNYVTSITSGSPATQLQSSGLQTVNQPTLLGAQGASLLGAPAALISLGVVAKELIEKNPTVDEEAKLKYLQKQNKMVYLGDIMHTALDCLYEPGTNKMLETTKNMNLRFIVGTIKVPNPKNPTSYITINPLQIPIDVAYFAEWYHETVASKQLQTYPVGTFIRDLIERLVNNLIYESCFGSLLPSHEAPTLRASFFSDHDSKWFETTYLGPSPNAHWFHPNIPYGFSGGGVSWNRAMRSGPNILMKSNATRHVSESKNYCVIYQAFPSYAQLLKSEETVTLRNDPYVPTMYYGKNYRDGNVISSVNITKTNSPYLREARYAGTNLGNLSLLSNVYDLSFSIEGTKANTLYYPGNVLNIIITDWAETTEIEISRANDSTPSTVTGRTNGSLYLGDSDPHTDGTRANIIGIGGYYVILETKYTRGHTSQDFKIDIKTKFLGTDARREIVLKEESGDTLVTEKEACAELVRDTWTKVEIKEELVNDDRDKEDRIEVLDSPSVAVREREVPNE